MNRDEAAETIADIKTRWKAGQTLPEIAAELHLPDRVVRTVLQTGTVPEPEPEWRQDDLLGGQPRPEHHSER